MTAEQKRQEDIDHFLSAKRAKQERGILATTPGLLLNELQVCKAGRIEMRHEWSQTPSSPT